MHAVGRKRSFHFVKRLLVNRLIFLIVILAEVC